MIGWTGMAALGLVGMGRKHVSRVIDGLSAAACDLKGYGRANTLAAHAHDVTMAALAFTISYHLKTGGGLSTPADVLAGTLYFTLIAATVFWITRTNRCLWHYVSLADMMAIARSATCTVVLFLPLYALVPNLSVLPAETLIITWLLLVVFLCGPRVAYRLMTDRMRAGGGVNVKRPLLLAGAGDGTELFLRALERDPTADFRVVGIVDEMGTNLRRSIHGVEVLGAMQDIETVVEALDRRGERPRALVITEDSLSPAALRSLLDRAERLGLTLSRLPRLTELRGGINDHLQIKPVAIEDLLGRPEAELDRAGMAELCRDARVLVTGAGGTIGSELVRQLSGFGPSHSTLVDNAELHLSQIDMELSERHGRLSRATVMADVRDPERTREIFADQRPDLVFHAAAMKHVPMVEMNPIEGVLTNVLGTRNVADSCVEFGVRTMVLISTDKAVNPTSVMGATKRIAECYCQSLDIQTAKLGGGATRFVTFRFGNVLGSTGSVVPLFQRQLASGGPLTVTHPHVTRYFMTTHEAVELVLQASALGNQSGDRSGTIFVLDMGEPIRIQDLARQMIRLAGLRYGRDVEIVYTGLRPGEKLYEEPLHASEEFKQTEVRGILLAAPRTADHAMLRRLIDQLAMTVSTRDVERTLYSIARLVPEYRPVSHDDGDLAAPTPMRLDQPRPAEPEIVPASLPRVG
jgi:O-antigen biosynthesis protein WbqV